MDRVYKACTAVGFAAVFLMAGFASVAQDSFKAESVENRVIDELNKLPELRHAGRFVDSLTHHRHGLTFITEERPHTNHPYYTVSVGYMHPDHYESYMVFYVWPATMSIKVRGNIDDGDRKLSLAEWRRSKWHEW